MGIWKCPPRAYFHEMKYLRKTSILIQFMDISHQCFSKFPHLSLNQGLQTIFYNLTVKRSIEKWDVWKRESRQWGGKINKHDFFIYISSLICVRLIASFKIIMVQVRRFLRQNHFVNKNRLKIRVIGCKWVKYQLF